MDAARRDIGLASSDRPRGRLFRKYVVLFVALVTGVLVISGLVEVYFSYQEQKAALVTLQREKALAAASLIENFLREVERPIAFWAAQSRLATPGGVMEQRRNDYIRLMSQALAITDVSYLDPAGKEQLRISRLAMDVVGSGLDYGKDPKFVEPKGRTYYGPVYFRKDSEPYITVALRGAGPAGGVTAAEVNLKFIWEVVSRIRIGKAGRAYVVDSRGQLIAHPDISLVLQKTDLSGLSQVKDAVTAAPGSVESGQEGTIAEDIQKRQVLTAHAAVAPVGWRVFVEQPLAEAFAPLYASLYRTGGLLVLGLVLSLGASLLLARRMVTPIRALQAGASRIGAGDLGHRIDVRTGDELEALAAQFNETTARLQESYATLEQKVEERTRELSESLEQQTATAEILRVISASPTDVQPVFDAIARSAVRLSGGAGVRVVRFDGVLMHLVASHSSEVGPLGGDTLRSRFPRAPDQRLGVGRAILDRAIVHIPDLQDDAEYDPETKAEATVRSLLAVPMMREGSAVGAIVVARRAAGRFTDQQVALLKTFADQAVIAVENTRLFQELQARVEELRALGEVSQAVSSSLDLGRVLDAVAGHAVQLSGADAGGIFEIDPDRQTFAPVTARGLSDEFVEALRTTRLDLRGGTIGRAAEAGRPVQIPDVEAATHYPLRALLLQEGFRAVLALPMGDAHVTRGMVLMRRTPGAFDDRVEGLLMAIANQSKIAIDNARLFREIEQKGRELEVANRHKSEFLANMSHELRTPLNAVIGFSEVLLERMFGELNDKQADYLQDILSSGRHLLSLINDILDLAKVEAGRMDLELAPFDLPAALENTLTLVRERAMRGAIHLTLAVEDGVGEIVGDERKVKQIVLNLLSNAVKFTPEGGQVSVRAGLAAGAVEIAVSDTGIGIAPEDQEAIFEEFRQVGSDALRKHEGTGLGLTLTRRFVELHGGRIRVESTVGQGSTFTFTLPEREPCPAS